MNGYLKSRNGGMVITSKRTYEQNGPVYLGPGFTKPSESFKLKELDSDGQFIVNRAKHFAVEQSIRYTLAKQSIQIQIQQNTAPKRSNTLSLLSRVYVGSISYDLKEENLKQAFSPFGPVRSVMLSWDANCEKHKGFAFLEFECPEAAQLAADQMNNTHLGGRQLRVGRPTNIPKSEPTIEDLITENKAESTIYVSSIHTDLSEEDIILVFEAFGKISSCYLVVDPLKPGKHRGFGFIEYESVQAASEAISSMNMFDLGGQFLRVGKAVCPQKKIESTAPTIPLAAAAAAASVTAKVLTLEAEQANKDMSSSNRTSSEDMIDVNNLKGIAMKNLSDNEKNRNHSSNDFSADQMGNHSDLGEQPCDRPDDEGLLEHQEEFFIRGPDARKKMMQKLLRYKQYGVMVLRNMIQPEEMDDGLESEIRDECQNFGRVDKILIHSDESIGSGGPNVKIFVVFEQMESVQQAINSLNCRYFAGRQIIAEQYDNERFEMQDYSG